MERSELTRGGLLTKAVFGSSCLGLFLLADFFCFRRRGTLWVWRASRGGIQRVYVFAFYFIQRFRRGHLGGAFVTCYVRKRPDTELQGADRELWDKVGMETTRKHSFALKIVEIDEMPGDQSVITFILCPVTSRVGSNVAHALKGIVSQKNMVLLLFHPVAPHISFNSNTKEVLFEPKHQDLGDVVDVVMWSSGAKGLHLYDCPQNSKAVRQISEFIQYHSSTTKG